MYFIPKIIQLTGFQLVEYPKTTVMAQFAHHPLAVHFFFAQQRKPEKPLDIRNHDWFNRGFEIGNSTLLPFYFTLIFPNTIKLQQGQSANVWVRNGTFDRSWFE
ncbi:hypothetical protein [Flagellimonas aurea]|nr:hypothetical protein [Allomuricauda aurea]